eukprot:6332263-Alexandrium_andersonii.AAC.1
MVHRVFADILPRRYCPNKNARRPSPPSGSRPLPFRPSPKAGGTSGEDDEAPVPVSYTHLTLPTICSV